MGSLCSWPSTRDTVASISPYVLSSTSSFSRGSTVVLQRVAGSRSRPPQLDPHQGPQRSRLSPPHTPQGADSHDLLQTLSGRQEALVPDQGEPLRGRGGKGRLDEAPVPLPLSSVPPALPGLEPLPPTVPHHWLQHSLTRRV